MLLLSPVLLAQKVDQPCSVGQEGLNLTDCLQVSDGQTLAAIYSTPADVINILTSNIFIVAGFILFFYGLYGGFLFIQDSTKGKEKATEMLTNALMGIIVMFIAYWIVRIIEIFIGQNIIF